MYNPLPRHVLTLRPGSAYSSLVFYAPEPIVISANNYSVTAPVQITRITRTQYIPILNMHLPAFSGEIGIDVGHFPRGRYQVELICTHPGAYPRCSVDLVIEGYIEIIPESFFGGGA